MRGPGQGRTLLSLRPPLNLCVQSRVCPVPGSPAPLPTLPVAVATDSGPPIHTPAIEDEYSGPKLEDGRVTATFMKELMQWYKDQKKLHRKCAYQVTPRRGLPSCA